MHSTMLWPAHVFVLVEKSSGKHQSINKVDNLHVLIN